MRGFVFDSQIGQMGRSITVVGFAVNEVVLYQSRFNSCLPNAFYCAGDRRYPADAWMSGRVVERGQLETGYAPKAS